jgi:glycosyltransferase involved in cell wall biosynthesis
VVKLGLQDRVVFTDFVSEEKDGFDSGGSCLVMPSLWGGFGIPVVEAMVPVV